MSRTKTAKAAPASSSPSTDQLPAGWSPIGISGLIRYGQQSRVYEEFLVELQGPQGMKNYREMADNDPIIGAVLFAAEYLSRNVQWRVDAADGSQEAARVADFVRGALFEDLENTWADTVSEILSMLPFGWALHEMIPKRRLGMNPPRVTDISRVSQMISYGAGTPIQPFAPSRFSDGLIGFRGLPLRAQETLFQWEWDEQSHVTAMQQMAPPDYTIRTIPISKALLFRTKVNKNNPEGRSLIRNAWSPYFYKKRIQQIEAIGIERDLAGYPLFKVAKPEPGGAPVPDIWNQKDPDAVATLAMINTLIRNVRRDEQEGMVVPWWLDFQLASTGSRRQFDTDPVVTRYDQRILQSVLADFVMTGHDQVGSKAMVETKSDLFAAALSAILTSISDVFNRFAIPKLMEWNALPMALAPKLVHGDVLQQSADVIADALQKFSAAGMAVFPNKPLEKTVLEAMHLPTDGLEPEMDDLDLDETERRAGVSATPVSAVSGDAALPETSLNGAQVASLVQIIQQVGQRVLPRDSGVQLISTAFNIDEAVADRIMGTVGTKAFTPAPPSAA